MNDQFYCRFWLRGTALLMGSLLFLSVESKACAQSTGESFTPSLISPSDQEDQSVLKYRLQAVKKDLEVFRTFAEHFSNNGEIKTVGQFQGPINNYLKKH